MRNHLDFYETPPWQTRALLRRVGVTGSILECCVGDSSLANVLRDHELNVATSDIDPKRTADHHLDATQEHNWRKLAPDWTITNPPFNKAIEIVQNAYHHSRVGVAMLLRLSFLEPTDKRGGWLAETPPPACVIILPRWSYKQNGKTDSVTTAWMVWQKHRQLPMLGTRPLFSQAIQIVPKSEVD